jgi:hypothetical protein
MGETFDRGLQRRCPQRREGLDREDTVATRLSCEEFIVRRLAFRSVAKSAPPSNHKWSWKPSDVTKHNGPCRESAIKAGHPGSQRLRAKTMKAIIAILWMTAAGAYAQQDIDLTGYKLVFSDELTP